jgi:hypothetical protein
MRRLAASAFAHTLLCGTFGASNNIVSEPLLHRHICRPLLTFIYDIQPVAASYIMN